MNTEKLLTVMQLAETLQVPRSRIYNMVFKKTIPYCKIGRTVRFRQSDIINLMQSSLVVASNN